MKRGGAPSLKYADLQKHFAELLAEKKTPPSLAEAREAVREIRRSKGMLIVPGDEDCRSAGSFFKNPVLSEEQFKELAERAEAKELEIPSYPALDAHAKFRRRGWWNIRGSPRDTGQGQPGSRTNMRWR